MSSDDRDTGAVTPEQVVERVQVADVDELVLAEGPWRGDVDQAGRFAERFGALRIVLVQDGQVVHGQDTVQAERASRQHGGRVPVIDITDLGWSEIRATAAAIGLVRLDQAGRFDTAALAELVLRIQEEDADLLAAAGFDDREVADLLALDGPGVPSLDALEQQFGAPQGDDFWPTIRVRVDPAVHARWAALVAEHDGDETAAFAALVAGE